MVRVGLLIFHFTSLAEGRQIRKAMFSETERFLKMGPCDLPWATCVISQQQFCVYQSPEQSLEVRDALHAQGTFEMLHLHKICPNVGSKFILMEGSQ